MRSKILPSAGQRAARVVRLDWRRRRTQHERRVITLAQARAGGPTLGATFMPALFCPAASMEQQRILPQPSCILTSGDLSSHRHKSSSRCTRLALVCVATVRPPTRRRRLNRASSTRSLRAQAATMHGLQVVSSCRPCSWLGGGMLPSWPCNLEFCDQDPSRHPLSAFDARAVTGKHTWRAVG